MERIEEGTSPWDPLMVILQDPIFHVLSEEKSHLVVENPMQVETYGAIVITPIPCDEARIAFKKMDEADLDRDPDCFVGRLICRQIVASGGEVRLSLDGKQAIVIPQKGAYAFRLTPESKRTTPREQTDRTTIDSMLNERISAINGN